MLKKEIPCQTGKACATCWNNDTCNLYKSRKEKLEKEQKAKEQLEKGLARQLAEVRQSAEKPGQME